MSISAIRTRLAAQLESINGVTRVFADEANVAPAAADCPTFLMSFAVPACEARSATNSSIEYVWHFELRFLYKPIGLGNPAENMSALEQYIKLLVDNLSANVTGAGTWQDWNKDTGNLEFTVGVLELAGTEANKAYWGFSCRLDITELVQTTMSAGV